MDDLIERLEKQAEYHINNMKMISGPLFDEAAKEIKELRKAKDAAYLERNQVVAAFASCFLGAGIAKTAIEGWEPEWHNCVYIDTPTGQVSWHYHDSQADLFAHLPPYLGKWDGHTTEEKYRRLAEFARKAFV